MELFKWVTIIVMIVMAAEVIKFYIKSNKDKNKYDEELNGKLERLNNLEERVRTLEKIVTDPSENLRRDIDNLKQKSN